MAGSSPATVAAYIAVQPAATRPVLQRVRRAIRAALPRAREVISYKIPAYEVDGRTVIYFAGWAKFYSLYPVTKTVRAKFADEIGGYELRGSTLRLPLDAPVPTAFIGRIAKFRAKEHAARNRVATHSRQRELA